MTADILYPKFVGDTGTLDRAFGQIAAGILNRDITFLFGAGMSIESDLPSSDGILLKLFDEEFFPPGSNRPPEDRKKQLMKEYPFEAVVAAVVNVLNKKEKLTTILKTTLLSEKNKPHAGHDDFVKICFWLGKPLIRKIYTTNFDLLIEKAFGADRAKTITEENSDECEDAIAKGEIPVIHLHGTLDKQYSMLEEDVMKDDHSSIRDDFESDLKRKVFVFVGYSMTDPDFRLIYSRYQKKMKNRKLAGKQTYIVYPANDYFSYELGRDVWKTRDATWIPLGAIDFFARLRRQIELHAVESLRNNVKQHNKMNDESLDDLIGKVSSALKVSVEEALVFLDQTRIVEGG